MYLAKNLNHLAQLKGIKKSGLAKALKISPSQVGNYFAGTSSPKIEGAIELARLFDVNLDDLILKDLTQEEARPFGAMGEDAAAAAETLQRMNQLLEQRVAVLERELKRNNPALAKELGIE